MNWIDFYNSTFCKQYKKVNLLRKVNCDKDILCKEYFALISVSCELIRKFINYQGIFIFQYRDVIKKAFQIGLINNGETWINLVILILNKNFYSEKELTDFIYSYYKYDNFKIFSDLNNTFYKLVEKQYAN